jgi:hypothetical protein
VLTNEEGANGRNCEGRGEKGEIKMDASDSGFPAKTKQSIRVKAILSVSLTGKPNERESDILH